LQDPQKANQIHLLFKTTTKLPNKYLQTLKTIQYLAITLLQKLSFIEENILQIRYIQLYKSQKDNEFKEVIKQMIENSVESELEEGLFEILMKIECQE